MVNLATIWPENHFWILFLSQGCLTFIFKIILEIEASILNMSSQLIIWCKSFGFFGFFDIIALVSLNLGSARLSATHYLWAIIVIPFKFLFKVSVIGLYVYLSLIEFGALTKEDWQRF